MAKTVEELEAQLQSQETLISGWKTEIGDARKKNEESERKLADALKKAEDLGKLLEAKISTGTTKSGDDTKMNQEPEQKPEDIEKALTVDEQKVLDDVFAEVKTRADKGDLEAMATIRKITQDPLYRTEFLRQAQAVTVSVPATWRKEPERKTGDSSDKESIAKLFETQRKKSSFVPPGSSGGANKPVGRGASSSKAPSMGKYSSEIFPERATA